MAIQYIVDEIWYSLKKYDHDDCPREHEMFSNVVSMLATVYDVGPALKQHYIYIYFPSVSE